MKPASLRVNGRELAPDDGRSWVIGRDPTADVVVDDPRVSRRHATLEWGPEGWVLRDAGSRNGTYLDGHRVSSLAVSGEISLRLGGEDGAHLSLTLPDAGPNAAADPGGGEPPLREASDQLGKLSAVHATPQPRVRIGRGQDNEIVLTDLRVSRRHAELVRNADGSHDIVDLGSGNGTFVNGLRVQRATLEELDVIGIGNHLFRFAEGTLREYVESGAASLEAVGLSVRMKETLLLDDVSFSLEPSSLLAIVGPSGAGKSTLLNTLTGARPADTGVVTYGGRDLYANYDELRMRMGYVPQTDILHTGLPVRRALEYAAKLRFPPDVDDVTRSARVAEVMEELGLTERADLPIEQLSGGQRKRTSIALELLTRPALLFLDEPTSGLDPGNEAHVMELLRQLADGGRIVIVVTHSVQSLDLCDRVLFMAPGGRSAYFGPPSRSMEFFRNVVGARDYADVFRRLEVERDFDWKGRFLSDPAHATYVRKALALSGQRTARSPTAPSPPPPQQRWIAQFGVLVRRHLSVIFRDRRTAMLLAVQAPLFGLLSLALLGRNVLTTRWGILASIFVWFLVIAATWLGTSNSIREIVKEFPIYRRERSVGLSISAYVASKAVVLGAITAAQCTLLVLIPSFRQKLPVQDPVGAFALVSKPVPTTGSVIGPPLLELWVDIVAAGLVALAIGLAVSAIIRTSDRALVILPLILVAQLVMSIPILPIRGVLQAGSYVSSARWGMAAAASTVSLNELRLPVIAGIAYGATSVFGPSGRRTALEGAFKGEWEHTQRAWTGDIGILGIIAALCLVAAWIFLRLRDSALIVSGRPRTSRTARAP
jgi:ABC transport system ATP-binding/permease protein